MMFLLLLLLWSLFEMGFVLMSLDPRAPMPSRIKECSTLLLALVLVLLLVLMPLPGASLTVMSAIVHALASGTFFKKGRIATSRALTDSNSNSKSISSSIQRGRRARGGHGVSWGE
jgi:glucose dehydrogenase